MAKSKSVLLVEDDPLSLFLMEEMFETLEIKAQVVSNGQQCIQRIEDTPNDYCLILMDIHMPAVSGAEATKRIRELTAKSKKKLAIYALTADPKWSDKKLLKDHGLDGYLPKPVEADALAKICRQYQS